MRAGWTQLGILRSRVPFEEMLADSATAPETRAKLALVTDARAYAVAELGFQEIGDSYTSFAELESDTLAVIVSAAYRDRLAFRTWWFPIIGSVPYRGYFSLEDALEARDDLEREGFDTYVRPTAAFSTLGWFSDPLYSTLLRLEDVALVESVLHELGHQHLYVPGQGVFNESFASFVGYASAVHFFCLGERGGPGSAPCRRARDRWEDAMTVSRYLDALEAEIRGLYARMSPATGEGSGAAPSAELLAERERIFEAARNRFVTEVRPTLRVSTYSYLGTEPLNNATLLSRSLYYRRLPEFHDLWVRFPGDLAELLLWFRAEAPARADPFELLAETPSPAEVRALTQAMAAARAPAPPPARVLRPEPTRPGRRPGG
jgi:predicted aminopeptidase